MKHFCGPCNMLFTTKNCLQRHFKCNRHTKQINNNSEIPRYECSSCGKKYSIRQSLHAHKKTCVSVAPETQDNQHEKQINEMKQAFEKERQEMKLAFHEQINKILEKNAGTTNNTTNNSSNIETQNITININAFGNENTDYIDDKAILACIGRVYKSIPSLLEKIYFDPKHPENHNIKITNKKLPYASVMGNNQKWKTVDRKDAIETMMLNGYNFLDEKYTENKNKMPAAKQQNFEGFQSKFETEDKDLMKQIKTEVDMMVLNGGNG